MQHSTVLMRTASSLVIVSALAAPAVADRSSIHATGSGDIGFTDNVFQEERGRQDGDLFFQLRPGFLYSWGIPRMIHDVSGELEITQYTLHGNEANVAGRAGWNALFLPGPRSQLSVSADAGTGVTSALTARTPPDQVVVELQPLQNQTFQSVSASEYGSYTITPDTRIAERFYARASEMDDNAMDRDPSLTNTVVSSRDFGGSLTLSRSWKKTSLSLDVGGSILRLERVAPVDAIRPSRLDRQRNPRVRLALGRDIDKRLSAGLDAGFVYVIPYGTDPYNPDDTSARGRGLYPLFGGNLSYTDGWGVGTMSLRRDVSPNLLLGVNTINEAAQIAAAMPLPWREDNRRRQPKLVGLGTLSILRTRFIDPVTADPSASFGVARIDLGVQYNVRPGFAYTIRYEMMWQTGDDNAMTPVGSFFRNTFFFSFKYRYPEDVAQPIPKRKRMRADGEEGLTEGEPVIQDLLDAESGEGGGRR